MYNQIILLGVVVSMIFTEITGLSAGLIVPGYLVLALHSPGRIVTTLIMPSGIAMADFIWSTPVCLSDPADLCAELCTFRMETASLQCDWHFNARYSGAGNRQTGILRCLSGNCRHYAFYGADLTAYRAKAARRVKGGVFA